MLAYAGSDEVLRCACQALLVAQGRSLNRRVEALSIE